MKSKVSALMDGELDQQNASSIIKTIVENSELRDEWQTYHLIGDTLRQSSRLSSDISYEVKQKLIAEPTVLSPKASSVAIKQQKYKVFAFSMAASVVAMVFGWFMMHDLYQPNQKIMMAQQPKQESNLPVKPLMVSTPIPAHSSYLHPPLEIDDYLFVHREFLPGTTMRGHVNVRQVTEYHERYGR